MGYVFLALTVSTVTMQFGFTKVYERRAVSGAYGYLIMPGVFAAVNTVLFLIMSGFRPEYSDFSLLVAIIFGFIMFILNLVGLIVIRFGKMSMYTAFLMLGGMLLPYLYGFIVKESLTGFGIAGMALLCSSLILQMMAKDGVKIKSKAAFFSLCAVIFVLNGINSTLLKIHPTDPRAISSNSFLVYTFAFQTILALVALLSLAAIKRIKAGRASKTADSSEVQTESVTAQPLSKDGGRSRLNIILPLLALSFAGLLCGISQLFVLSAAKVLPATVLFPVLTGAVIILTAFAGRIFFKEKITLFTYISLAIMFAATVLMIF